MLHGSVGTCSKGARMLSEPRAGLWSGSPSKFGWPEPEQKTFRWRIRNRNLNLGSGSTALIGGASELDK